MKTNIEQATKLLGELLDWSDRLGSDEILHIQEVIATLRGELEPKRVCDTCGKPMDEGFCAGDGEEYYCSEECLFVDGYTPEQYEEDYNNGHIYYTEWEE